MKKLALYLMVLVCFLACKGDDAIDSGCVSQLLPNYAFDTGGSINLNLPQYSGLQFAGNTLFLPSYGVKGIYLYNTGSSVIAFEASDPAHEPNNCSFMSLNGIELTCSCDDYKYQLLTGEQIEGGTGNCLRAYRTVKTGNIIRVYN